MVKRFNIPLIDKALFLYVGKEEWARFIKGSVKDGLELRDGDKEVPAKGSGRQYGSHLYVDNLKDRNLLYHELSHFLDDLMDYIAPNGAEKEFKAYCVGWIFDIVTEWANKETM